MAEFEVYKCNYNNYITSLIEDPNTDDGGWFSNITYILSELKPLYWGTLIKPNFDILAENEYIDFDILKTDFSLPGNLTSMQKIDGIGTTPTIVMQNDKGTWAYFTLCRKIGDKNYDTQPNLFQYRDGRWYYSSTTAALNIWNGYRPAGIEGLFETASIANSSYANVIRDSAIGFVYMTEAQGRQNRIEPFIIFADSTRILKQVGTFGYDVQSKINWDKVSVTGPDVPGPPPLPDPTNPYQPGGSSGTGTTPPGTFDDDSDPIPDSSLPTLSAANTGFTRIYNPTLAQVQDLARYLWTDETVIQTIWNHIKQYFEDPMQAIIGFNLVPCTVPNAGSQNFALMYIDTGVSMNVAANQFVDVDCGTVKLDRYYGSALDQSPYTRVSCFLPFIGTVRLNTDEVMGATLRVKYRIDICSGSCVAKILVDGNVIYQYSGHCAINIPFSSADFSSYVSSAISVARLAIGAGVAGAAGIAAASVGDPEQQTNRTVTVNRTTTTTARNPTTGRQITTGTRTISETRSYPIKQKEPQDTTQASFNALSPENISNTAGQIMASKPSIEHSGSFSGNTGYLGVRRPYLLIERPNMCMPEQYQQFNGFPAMITMNLSTCKGFTRVHQVQLTGMSATNPEQAEILSLLKSGVYF